VRTEGLAVHAHKVKVTIEEDHRVEVQLPADFPDGPAEIIVLANRSAGEVRPGSNLAAQQRMLAALDELRTVPLTPEEREVLDGFESFQREHPIRFASLKEEV
jgi:hypothetical protein